MENDEVVRVVRESCLDEARASLERNIAQIQEAQGAEPDDEEISRQLLCIEDTRPFNYSLASVMDEDELPVLGGHRPRPPPSSHHEKLTSLFIGWCDKVTDGTNTIKSHKLPSMFRFALQRPLMPESKLQKTLEEFGIDPVLSFLSEMRIAHTGPQGRNRRTIYGLDPDVRHHVSSAYRNSFPKGLSLLYKGEEQPGQVVTTGDNENNRQTQGTCTGWELGTRHQRVNFDDRQMHDCLWSLYDLVQDCLVDLEEAPDRYREILGNPDLSSSDLMRRLREFGVPVQHIENANAGKLRECDRGSHERDLVAQVTSLVELYTSGGFLIQDVIGLIKITLSGLQVNDQLLQKLLRDANGDAASIAEQIWEETAEEETEDSGKYDMVNDEGLFTQPVSDEFADMCDEVLRASLMAEDAIAMLQAAVGEDNLTSAQKSHVLSKLDPAQTAAFCHLFAISADEKTGLEEAPGAALSVPETTVVAGDLLTPEDSPRSSISPVRGTLSNTYLTGDMSSTAKWPYAPSLEQRASENPSKDGAIENSPMSFLLKATNVSTEGGSGKATQESAILNEPSKSQPTTVLISHEGKGSLDSCGDPAILMPPPTSSTRLQQLTKLVDTSRSSILPPRTPMLTLVPSIPVLGKLNQQKPTNGAWRRFVREDEKYDCKSRSTSPEKGRTSDMFGLSLPTKDARVLGTRLGLPPDYIQEQIRSKTAPRVRTKKFRKASTNVTFPSQKRKASKTISSSHRIKIPKHNTAAVLFAREDDDHETFILGCFTPEILRESKLRCPSCHRLQCACRKRKRTSLSKTSSSHKKQSFDKIMSTVQPEATQRLQDASSMLDPSPPRPSAGTIEDGLPDRPSLLVPSIKPVKLRLNPPKPPGQPKLPSPSTSPGSSCPESSPGLSTPFTSPSPPRSPTQLKPPKALLSQLLRGMADQDIMDTFRRLSESESPEGVRIRHLVDRALVLTSHEMRRDAYRRSKGFDSRGLSEEQAFRVLRQLVEAQLRMNQRQRELIPGYPNTFGLDASQKTATPSRDLSILQPHELGSSLTELQANVSTYELSMSRPALARSDRKRADLCDSNARQSPDARIGVSRDEPIPSIETDSMPESQFSEEIDDPEALGPEMNDLTGRSKTPAPLSQPTTRDHGGMTYLSNLYKSKAKGFTRLLSPTSALMPCSPETSVITIEPALHKDCSRRYNEQKRTGPGNGPWPGRGITPRDAIDKAHEEAVAQRKGIFLYMAERRLIRPRANYWVGNRFFQSANNGPSSGSGITSSLNKLFDKYRGIPALYLTMKCLRLTRGRSQITQ